MMLSDNLHLFKKLSCIDIILTNKCNLRCSYCFEQHKKDYSAFTVEKIKQVWDFLKTIPTDEYKQIQFYGGEPLLQKRIILDFLEKYCDEIEHLVDKQSTTMVTNGLLLDENFSKEYFSHGSGDITISIDTIIPEYDQRGIGSSGIQTILRNTETALKYAGPSRLFVRSNLTPDTLESTTEFIKYFIDMGITRFCYHPITSSNEDGHLVWDDESWNQLNDTLNKLLSSYSHKIDSFSTAEYIGIKGKNGLLDTTDLAVDATGDFTSCYVFLNNKDKFSDHILGNIFDNHIDLEKYEHFTNEYTKMLNSPKCKSCNERQLCYLWPSANLISRGELFSPDEMCSKIAKLYGDTNAILLQHKMKAKLDNFMQAYNENGDIVLAKTALCLTLYYITHKWNDIDQRLVENISYKKIFGLLYKLINGGGIIDPNNIIEYINDDEKSASEIAKCFGVMVEKEIPAIMMLHLLIAGKVHGS